MSDSVVDLVVSPVPGAESMGRHSEPVTAGIPIPRGMTHDCGAFALVDVETGTPVRLQTEILDRWSDGTIRWLLLDFQADAPANQQTVYRLVRRTPPDRASGLTAAERNGSIEVNTGAIRVCFKTGTRFPFHDAATHSGATLDVTRSRFDVTDGSGARCGVIVKRVSIERTGAVRAVVLVEGEIQSPGREHLLDLACRVHFFAGLSSIRMNVTLRNPRAAEHPGGYWTLGSGGAVYLRDASITIAPVAAAGSVALACSPESGIALEDCGSEVELYQDSSGGENWNSSSHRNRLGDLPIRFRGYRFRTSVGQRQGLRATPIVVLRRGAWEMSVAMPHFWQNFPKAIEGSADGITVRLFPRQFADVHEIQGGEQKTHTFYVALGPDTVSSRPLAWTRAPLVCRAEPQWYSAAGAVPYLLPAADDPNHNYLALTAAAIEGSSSFDRKREIIDEYGWRNFGDIYADHETRFHTGPHPLVSHYNNQYDAIAGCAYQFMRSGDLRWWTSCLELAAHVVDIDIYHTDGDKAAYNRGLFWHTSHYVDAGLASHRAFPRDPHVSGGGPAPEHNYTTGLMLHYFLTGELASRDTAIDLGRWVIDMDDGRKTPLRWLSRADTGLASVTGTIHEHGPGRAPGNSVNALLDAHRLSGDAVFLEKAEQLIRRAIHPADDIDARDLLDAERRWYYTVFLQAIGKYLDYKAELGQLDWIYAYARESLLAYARWMARREYPYLDKPEILEYPTETWAAQDMRKSEVFKFAARHAAGEERERFLERARFFFEYSVSTLLSMPTRTAARPVVLMLSYGFMQGYFETHPPIGAPGSTVQAPIFGTPQIFVPQKVLARQRLAMLAVAILGTMLAAAAVWLI